MLLPFSSALRFFPIHRSPSDIQWVDGKFDLTA